MNLEDWRVTELLLPTEDKVNNLVVQLLFLLKGFAHCVRVFFHLRVESWEHEACFQKMCVHNRGKTAIYASWV